MENTNFENYFLKSMVYTLTYESIESEKMTHEDMTELLDKARLNNTRDNITGCLIYYMGGFIQVLEGDKKMVTLLYEKIKEDSRHKNVHMFSQDDDVKRTFPNWGMAYYPIDSKSTSKSEFEQFKRNLMLLADFTEPTNVTAKLFWDRTKFLLSNPPKDI